MFVYGFIVFRFDALVFMGYTHKYLHGGGGGRGGGGADADAAADDDGMVMDDLRKSRNCNDSCDNEENHYNTFKSYRGKSDLQCLL